ncbi:hypothetical protein A2U01_0032505, partial [Trifolium medium]|nr:hypothetical protein [Trifolium medium]
MATFSVKVRLQLGTCMLQTVRTHLKIPISNLFWSLLQILLPVEVLFVIAGKFLEEWVRTNIVKAITFVMKNMEMHVIARISLMWTGFLLLEILVK